MIKKHPQARPALTVSALRANIYQILDEVISSGVPLKILRNGKVVHLVPEAPVSKLSRLTKRPGLLGSADEIISIDWSSEWHDTTES